MGIMIFHGCLSAQVMSDMIDVACFLVILALTVVLVGTLAEKFEGSRSAAYSPGSSVQSPKKMTNDMILPFLHELLTKESQGNPLI